MPELPEVETVMRGLQPFMEGKRLVRVEQRRPTCAGQYRRISWRQKGIALTTWIAGKIHTGPHG